jgi:sugar/nucleoside kinase (ribokinase family)
MTHDRPYDILAIGDLNIDLILGVEGLPAFGTEIVAHSMSRHSGGVAANLAVYCARLGLRVALLARVGSDDSGDFLVSELQHQGVVTDYILRDGQLATGVCVSLSGPHDRAFVTYLGTIDSLTGADVNDDLLNAARVVHIGSYFLQSKLQAGLPDVLRRARAAGCRTSLDTGYDPYERWDSGLSNVWPHLDLCLPNEVEACALTGQDEATPTAHRALVDRGPAVALKLGPNGARFLSRDHDLELRPFQVDVVDTTCCGDAFDAGFLSAWTMGKGPLECLVWGNACGALVASSPGNSADRLSPDAIARVIQTGRVD